MIIDNSLFSISYTLNKIPKEKLHSLMYIAGGLRVIGLSTDISCQYADQNSFSGHQFNDLKGLFIATENYTNL